MSRARPSNCSSCCALISLVFLLIALYDTDLPWATISDDYTRSWEFADDTVEYTSDVYYNLLYSVECQTFKENSDLFYKDQVICSSVDFDDASEDWEMYAESCEFGGIAAFAWLFTATAIVVLVVLLSTFSSLQRKLCCNLCDAQRGLQQYVAPAFAALAPICTIQAIAFYHSNCIWDAREGDVVTINSVEVHRTVSGSHGYDIAISAAIFLVFWWFSWTFWFYMSPRYREQNYIVRDTGRLMFVGQHAKNITLSSVADTVEEMKLVFSSNYTRKLSYRREALKDLYRMISENEKKIKEALHKDMGRDELLAYVGDITPTLSEIQLMLDNLEEYNAPKQVGASIGTFPAVDYEVPEPYGTVLVISTWNFPFATAFRPIAGAIAAGNNVIFKPCQTGPECSKLICDLVHKYVNPRFVQVVGHHYLNDDYSVTDKLMENQFDYIFFTGSTKGGRYISQKAAKYLTPCHLELGGKNPVYVDETANIERACNQILMGRTLSCGQVCVAPDYVLCHEDIIDQLEVTMTQKLRTWFGSGYNKDVHPYVGHIVNEVQYKKVTALIQQTKGDVVTGGSYDPVTRRVDPTIVRLDSFDDPGMEGETFGPVLWLKSVEDMYQAVSYINSRPKPLSLYVFSEDRQTQDYVVSNTSSGGAGINAVSSYLMNEKLPFAGVGDSGMGGSYHGKWSFSTFSHMKAVSKSLYEIDFMYPPRDKWLPFKLLRFL